MRLQALPKSNWHEVRKYSIQAFQHLYTFVEDKIIEKENVVTCKELQKIFSEILTEISPDSASIYRACTLEKYVLLSFSGILLLYKSKNKSILFSSKMMVIPIIMQKKLGEMNSNSKLREVASTIRKEILAIKTDQLPETVNVDDILEGECQVPQIVTDLFRNILQGISPYINISLSNNRRIGSMSHDLMYNTTEGKIRPSKHLTLGMAIKNLTGNRKVMEILNRYGHSVSYTTIEELETELSYASVATRKL